MRWKAFVRDYLTFSKNDRIAAFGVAGLLLAAYIIPHLSAQIDAPLPIAEDKTLTQLLDTLQQQPASQNDLAVEEENSFKYPYAPASTSGFTEGELFAFDPNTLPAAGWKKLGLNEKTTKTILNYRSKGGRFYKPEDLQKIWGLPAGFYDRVAGYIRLPNQNTSKAVQPQETPRFERKERTIAVVNVNEADTTALIALPGIGSKLAHRIIAFREKLGGFYTVEQLKETYGLPDSTFQKLKPYFHVNDQAVRKWNLNTATKDDLKAHPYLRWNLANAIVEYRTQHGQFKSLEELKNIMLIDDAIFQKIIPYLTL